MVEIKENRTINTEENQRESKGNPKTVPERVDQTIDGQFSVQEISDFIFDKNNQKENIKDLCDYLEMEIDQGNLNDKKMQERLLGDIKIFFDSEEAKEMYKGIESKISEDIELNEDEKAIIYLELMINGGIISTITQGRIDFKNKIRNAKKEFNPKEPIQDICNGEFLTYIQYRFINFKYNLHNESGQNTDYENIIKKQEEKYIEEVTKKNKKRKDNEKNETDELVEKIEEDQKKLESDYERLPEMPNIIGEKYVHANFNKILKWAEENGYSDEIKKTAEIQNQEIRNKEKREAYIKYDIMLLTFSKYCEIINNKHEDIVRKAGYFDMKEFYEEMLFIEEFQKEIQNEFPDLEETIKRAEPYLKELTEIQKEYFLGKSEEEIEKDIETFKEIQEFDEEQRKQYGITENIIKDFEKTPETAEEAENFFRKLNNRLLYESEVNKKKSEYGGRVDYLYEYFEKINSLKEQQNYNEEDIKKDLSTIEEYEQFINEKSKSTTQFYRKGQEILINKKISSILERYSKYTELMDKNPKLKTDLKNIGMINKVLSDPTSENFWVQIVKNDKISQKEKQEKIDNVRESLKKYNPIAYHELTSLIGFCNGLVDATIGVGSSLGVLLLTTKWGNTLLNSTPLGLLSYMFTGHGFNGAEQGEGYFNYTVKSKNNFDNCAKKILLIPPQSTEQKEPVYYYDETKGEYVLNFKFDNTISTVSGTAAQMFVLIYGGTGIAKGVEKGAKVGMRLGIGGKTLGKITSDTAGKMGLFGMGFITQIGQSYTEARLAGLDGEGAFAYSIFSSLIQSSLELVSPNEILLGKGTGMGKGLIRTLCKSESGKKLAGKYFLKTMFKEISEETLQEGLQLAAGNILNGIVNDIRGSDLEVNRDPKNFLSTAIITALTTGLTTSVSAGRVSLQILKSSNPELMKRISTDTDLYNDVMRVLNETIEGKMKIPDIKIEDLQELRGLLAEIKEIIDNEQENNHLISEFEKYLKDAKLLPIGYEYLTNDLAIYLIQQGESIENINKNVDEYKNLIQNNINFLVEVLNIDKKKLGNLISYISGKIDYNRVEYNVKQIGIKNTDDIIKLKDFIFKPLFERQRSNIKLLLETQIKTAEDFEILKNIILQGNTENLEIIIKACKNGHTNLTGNDIKKLEQLILFGNSYSIKTLKLFGDLCCKKVNDFIILQEILKYEFDEEETNKINLLSKLGIQTAEDFLKLKNIILYGNIKNLTKIIDLKEKNSRGNLNIEIIIELENLLNDKNFQNYLEGNFIKLDELKYIKMGFNIDGKKENNDNGFLNNSLGTLYPEIGINFNEKEAEKILNFVNSIGGINKGYTILILTMEKMIRDGIDSKNFNQILLEKIANYEKIFEVYPEDKIPDQLKISIGIEFEITHYYANWFKQTFGIDYKAFADKIVKNGKIGIEKEGAYEFATKPSTNPMVALLEIHLLQELNLLDINDMQKLSGASEAFNYQSRNGTGYHLNIGSDSEIGIDENIEFIQILCTILPRSGINNGANVKKINPQGYIKSKDSEFSVFTGSTTNTYIEFRTYSVDDVELFEKNVLFNTYAVMGSQAEKKVSNITSKIIMELQNNDKIKNVDDLMKYLEDNNLFKDNQDLKSKKIAAEFIFMQIHILRIISDYNNNFIENELFGNDLVGNLSESRKNLFFDLIIDGKETMGFDHQGHSSMIVKRLTNLDNNFDFQKYIKRNESFTDEETKTILKEHGNNVDEKWIPYITTWLNKQLLWNILSNSSTDTQNLQQNINNKISNFDRIKSYIRQTDQNSKIDRKYIQQYFKENMSITQFNPYEGISIDFMNKIINLNNFFLKKDDTNANGVLQTTILNGNKDAEPDISKSSIFETGGYMRKGYNYYQGGSDGMLLHKSQTIAISYMENVKKILNSN